MELPGFLEVNKGVYIADKPVIGGRRHVVTLETYTQPTINEVLTRLSITAGFISPTRNYGSDEERYLADLPPKLLHEVINKTTHAEQQVRKHAAICVNQTDEPGNYLHVTSRHMTAGGLAQAVRLNKPILWYQKNLIEGWADDVEIGSDGLLASYIQLPDCFDEEEHQRASEIDHALDKIDPGFLDELEDFSPRSLRNGALVTALLLKKRQDRLLYLMGKDTRVTSWMPTATLGVQN
jgi:hypothetical protein